MKKRSFLPELAAALVISATLTNCSDSRDIVSPQSRASGGLVTVPATVNVLTRNSPLASAVTATATIGALGGTMTLPEAGLTISIPAFALSTPTQISVTAVAGSQVAYEFEPHGLQFTAPLVVTQVLDGTSASGQALIPGHLFAGYFADLSALNPLNGTALVNEILGTSVNLGRSSATFSVWHFSGYLLWTGEGDSGDGGGSH